MFGISAIFNIGRGALQANQIAMEVVSHNIANVNTEGYTRQQAILQSENPYDMNRLKVGLGVRVDSVSQAFDRYTTRQIQQNTSTLREFESKADILSHLEALLNETDDSGLSQVMNEFWNAWQNVANNPGESAGRTALLGKAKILTEKFNTMNSDLYSIQDNLDTNLKMGIPEVNQLTRQIAEMNDKIVAAEAIQTSANDLRDGRNNLLQELSGWLGITYVEQSNGSVTVLSQEGILLVNGKEHWDLSMEGGAIYWNGIAADISSKLTEGKIGGWLDLRDETVPEYRANLDELAGSLIQTVNTLHFNGYTLAGETRKYFFENFRPGEVPNSGDFSGAADFIALSSDVLGHPENIAAGGLTGDPGNNENARNIAALQTDDTIQIRRWTYTDRGANTSNTLQTSTMDSYYRELVGDIGMLTDDSSQNQEFTQVMLDRLDQLRDSVSGVNLDEELAEMMKVQRAYEAAAKIVTVADEMLQSILEMR